MKAWDKQSFPQSLKLLLENENFILVGRQIGGDIKRLRKLGVVIMNMNRKELRTLGLQHDPDMPNKGGTSLCNLCKVHLNLNLLKTHETANFSAENISVEAMKYAALDSILLQKIGEILISKISAIENESIVVPSSLEVGNNVRLFLGAKIVAPGAITHVENKSSSKKWGKTSVGKGKVLLKTHDVYYSQIKLTFVHSKSINLLGEYL